MSKYDFLPHWEVYCDNKHFPSRDPIEKGKSHQPQWVKAVNSAIDERYHQSVCNNYYCNLCNKDFYFPQTLPFTESMMRYLRYRIPGAYIYYLNGQQIIIPDNGRLEELQQRLSHSEQKRREAEEQLRKRY